MGAYCRNATKRESAENCAGAALKVDVESAFGCICGRPVNPRGTRNSVLPDVARTTSSPSPTAGPAVYAVHFPSGESDGPERARHVSYVSCDIGFFADWASETALITRSSASARHEAEKRRVFMGRASGSDVGRDMLQYAAPEVYAKRGATRTTATSDG